MNVYWTKNDGPFCESCWRRRAKARAMAVARVVGGTALTLALMMLPACKSLPIKCATGEHWTGSTCACNPGHVIDEDGVGCHVPEPETPATPPPTPEPPATPAPTAPPTMAPPPIPPSPLPPSAPPPVPPECPQAIPADPVPVFGPGQCPPGTLRISVAGRLGCVAETVCTADGQGNCYESQGGVAGSRCRPLAETAKDFARLGDQHPWNVTASGYFYDGGPGVSVDRYGRVYTGLLPSRATEKVHPDFEFGSWEWFGVCKPLAAEPCVTPPPVTPTPGPSAPPSTPPSGDLATSCGLSTMPEVGGDENPPGSGRWGACWYPEERQDDGTVKYAGNLGRGPRYQGDVSAVIGEMRALPGMMNGDAVTDEDRWMNEAMARLAARGFCVTRGGPEDEVGIKKENGVSEQYDLLQGPWPRGAAGLRWPNDGHTVTCKPARF